MRHRIIFEVRWDDVEHGAASARAVATDLGDQLADRVDLLVSRGAIRSASMDATIDPPDDETGAEP